MNWSIDFAPLMPEAFFWVAGAIGLALIALLVIRRTRGSFLRALALTAVLLALLNPTLKEEQRDSLANIAIVVIDETT